MSAQALAPGDYVSVARGVAPGAGKEERAWILGLMLGDANFTADHTIVLTIGQPELLEAARVEAVRVGFELKPLRRPEKQKYDYRVNGATGWIRELGLHGRISSRKHIPEIAWTWDAESVAALVAGYLEADGTVRDGKWGREVVFASTSGDLLSDVQSLLLRLGITSRRRGRTTRYRGEERSYWDLSVNGSSMDRLAEVLPPIGPKVRKLRSLPTRESADRVDLIPNRLVQRFLPHGPQASSKAHYNRDDRPRRSGYRRDKVLAETDLSPMAERNFHLAWDRVEEIEVEEPEQTYSIEVEGAHTHLVGDFITHNTHALSIGRVLYEIGKNTSIRVRIVCADDTLAENILQELETHVERNPRLHEVFPNLKKATPWTKNQMTVERTAILNDPTVQAESVLGGSTGPRSDFLLGDDLCTYRNTLAQPKLIAPVVHAWKNVWMNTLTARGRVVVVGTPWHDRDILWTLRSDPEWKAGLWERAAEDPKTHEILWAARYTHAILMAKKRQLGPRFYARGYELKPISDQELTFADKSVQRDEALPWGEPVPPGALVVSGLDPATAGEAVYLTAYLDPVDHRRVPVEMIRMRGWRPRDLAQAVVESYIRWRPQFVTVENNATQETFADLIDVIATTMPNRPPPVPLVPLFTGKQKWDPAIGLPALAVKMEQGLWPIPSACRGCGADPCICHKADCECDSCAWANEIRTHPQGRSDIIMAQWLIEQEIQQLEFDAAAGSGEDVVSVPKPDSMLRESF